MLINVRKYTSPMDPMGMQFLFKVSHGAVDDFSNSNCLRFLPKWQGHERCYSAGLEEATLPRGMKHLYRNHGSGCVQRELTYTKNHSVTPALLGRLTGFWVADFWKTCDLGGWPAWPCSIVPASILGRFFFQVRSDVSTDFEGFFLHENEDGWL